MSPKRIVITGGTGFLGSALVNALRARGDDVVVLRRGSTAGTWDPASGRLDPGLLEGADAVVNLNGVGIGDRRWTPSRKKLIVSSRTDSTGLLARTMAAMPSPPHVFVSASAIGYYGDTGDTLVDEKAPAGDDFHAAICVAWEDAAKPAADAGIRVVHPRTGLVLSSNGGVLKPMTWLFKLGLGGRLGDGSQWWSWISMRDEIRALAFLIDGDLSGPVNLVGPNAVRNVEFARTFGVVLGRPAVVPVPKFALDIRLGKEMAESLGYGSLRVAPTKLIESGFEFTSNTVRQALAEEFG